MENRQQFAQFDKKCIESKWSYVLHHVQMNCTEYIEIDDYHNKGAFYQILISFFLFIK